MKAGAAEMEMELLYLFTLLIAEESIFQASDGGQVVKTEGCVGEKNEKPLVPGMPKASTKMTRVRNYLRLKST